MYITIRAGYTMTIKEIRQHKNNTIRQQIFTYLIHVRKEISFIDTRFFTVSNIVQITVSFLVPRSPIKSFIYEMIVNGKYCCHLLSSIHTTT